MGNSFLFLLNGYHSWSWFNVGPYGKGNLFFFSESTNLIEPKLCMNCYWVVLYKMFTFDFLCGSESKIAATAENCLSYMKKKLLLRRAMVFSGHSGFLHE